MLYRLNQSTNTYDVVAQINDRYATHYVDTNLAPETTYTYQMRTFSGDSISPSGASVSATTMPLMDSVAFSQAFSGLPNKVKIIWRPHTDPSVVGYVIKRANANSSDFDTIAQVEGRLQAEYIDNKVKANKTYSYTIHAKNNKGVLSKPSQVMSATTKELP